MYVQNCFLNSEGARPYGVVSRPRLLNDVASPTEVKEGRKEVREEGRKTELGGEDKSFY
jgi:hypothetical protein